MRKISLSTFLWESNFGASDPMADLNEIMKPWQLTSGKYMCCLKAISLGQLTSQ